MKNLSWARLLVGIWMALIGVTAYAAQPADNVTVHYRDPAQFTEAKHAYGMNTVDADAYLKPLKAYIAERASRILAAGRRLDIEVTDVDRAGEYEPWRGSKFNNVRIIKDVYPPRIDLNFTLYDASGKVLRSGTRKLRDLSFMSRVSGSNQDSLRYEKSLIDRWLRQGADAL